MSAAGCEDVPRSEDAAHFSVAHRGFRQVFRPGRLSLGLVVPIERYDRSRVPTLADHLDRVQQAEALGFASVWLRDVPFDVPTFGDAGQVFDPFVYLGVLAAQTHCIGLGVASIVLPLRHPAHVAKAAATVDVLSGGRLLLGVASGDRPDEYPAMGLPFDDRGVRFRDSVAYIRGVHGGPVPFDSPFGVPRRDLRLLPRPTSGQLPLLITGSSRQSLAWRARHGDAWMTYPRPSRAMAEVVSDWRETLRGERAPDKPLMQPLYLDLVDDDDAPIEAIHLGVRTGIHGLLSWLAALEQAGVNHVALNLRFQRAPVPAILERLAEAVLPRFPTLRSDQP